jgi:ribose/xylose/arabinose/galactoside ABC-type transport system permease subunit
VTALVAATTSLFDGGGPWYSFASLGLLASALSLSIRAGTVNLAVVGIATLASVVYARQFSDGGSPTVALAVAVAVAALVGLALAVTVVLTRAPGWAVSLIGIAALYAVLLALTDNKVALADGADMPDHSAGLWWSIASVVIAVAGGIAGLLPAVRRFGRQVVTAIPFGNRLGRPLVGLLGSAILAGLSGVLMVQQYSTVLPSISFERLALALSVVLMAGTSLTAARGAVAGVPLATWLLVVAGFGLASAGAPEWVIIAALPAAAALLGLAGDRLMTVGDPSVNQPPS